MPTISADQALLRGAAVLLLLGAGAAALASGTIEIDPRFHDYGSRAACEEVLKRRHGAALARFAATPADERRTSRVDVLKRDGDEHLTYFELLDLTVETPEVIMPRSQTELFTCRGSLLEHRISYEAGGYDLAPPPASLAPPAQKAPKP